jgi:hypothetical protein
MIRLFAPYQRVSARRAQFEFSTGSDWRELICVAWSDEHELVDIHGKLLDWDVWCHKGGLVGSLLVVVDGVLWRRNDTNFGGRDRDITARTSDRRKDPAMELREQDRTLADFL